VQVAYVISAYKLPQQLVRLVRRLDTPNSTFAIHVDRKTPDAIHRQMVQGLRDLQSVRFVERHTCHWGGFGHVRATLKGIDRLLRDGIAFDFVVLLSGQDYPLRTPRAIEEFLARAGGRSFMSHWPLPHEPWSGRGGLDRIERWHLVGPRHLHLSLALRRRLPGGLVPFGGGPYWCLARPLVERVHEVVLTRPDLVRFFEHAFIPDELFFQTILLNSVLADSIAGRHLHYISWDAEPGPKILGVDDVETLLDSEKLFARKFDVAVDPHVLDLIDERLREEHDVLAR
jgi:hypothetical protein